LCTNFKRNRPTFISKSAPVSQAEALNRVVNLVPEYRAWNSNVKFTIISAIESGSNSKTGIKTVLIIKYMP